MQTNSLRLCSNCLPKPGCKSQTTGFSRTILSQIPSDLLSGSPAFYLSICIVCLMFYFFLNLPNHCYTHLARQCRKISNYLHLLCVIPTRLLCLTSSYCQGFPCVFIAVVPSDPPVLGKMCTKCASLFWRSSSWTTVLHSRLHWVVPTHEWSDGSTFHRIYNGSNSFLLSWLVTCTNCSQWSDFKGF